MQAAVHGMEEQSEACSLLGTGGLGLETGDFGGMALTVSSYRDLEVWKVGVQLALAIYKLTSSFPDSERFGLTSQMRRCAVSIPSNIAEGHARLSTREFIRHLSIALGSLAELETKLHIAAELGIARNETTTDLFSTADRLGKQLRSLTKSLQSRLNKSQF
jgi:four helix bundle protein